MLAEGWDGRIGGIGDADGVDDGCGRPPSGLVGVGYEDDANLSCVRVSECEAEHDGRDGGGDDGCCGGDDGSCGGDGCSGVDDVNGWFSGAGLTCHAARKIGVCWSWRGCGGV